jgi:uncharacterized membrane protein
MASFMAVLRSLIARAKEGLYENMTQKEVPLDRIRGMSARNIVFFFTDDILLSSTHVILAYIGGLSHATIYI